MVRTAHACTATIVLLGLGLCALMGCAPAGTPVPTPEPPPAPTPTAGIPVQGRVTLNGADGPGLPDVAVYARGGYGSTEGPARLLATTDEEGYYWNGNAIPGMVIWAELDGYAFAPATRNYMGAGESCTDACDFSGQPVP